MRKCLPKPSLSFDRTRVISLAELANEPPIRSVHGIRSLLWRKSFDMSLTLLDRSRGEVLERADSELRRRKFVPGATRILRALFPSGPSNSLVFSTRGTSRVGKLSGDAGVLSGMPPSQRLRTLMVAGGRPGVSRGGISNRDQNKSTLQERRPVTHQLPSAIRARPGCVT